MKRVRILLRVSSNQQLEADGDLSVQRQIVTEYISKVDDWQLDSKEYFEGSSSGYKNSVSNRDVLQEALEDAKKQEYDILVAYKDDRIGRRMWEIGEYIMKLKSNGVDIYTVKDGCISPENDDVMGQMMLALRYGNAQKSSSDTAMRVKDTAQKLVKKGKFMGGTAPYGYRLEQSGELSKHGRVLHKLVIVPKQAEVVKHIYELSLIKEYGSAKIAKELNEEEQYRKLAPNDVWKSGTITSILTNPIYAGYATYKRRERINGRSHRLDSKEWIRADKPNRDICIIDSEVWNRTQDKRKARAEKYGKNSKMDINNAGRNTGMLPLIDVAYCGYCGRKLTNGSKYNYWTIKKTGEKKSSRTSIYRCPAVKMGMTHPGATEFRANEIEEIVFECLEKYIERLQENQDIVIEIEKYRHREYKALEEAIQSEEKRLEKIQREIAVMENEIANAITGNYVLSIEELMEYIKRHKKIEQQQRIRIQQKKEQLVEQRIHTGEAEKVNALTWEKLLKNSKNQTKRTITNKLTEYIAITEEQVIIRLKGI